MIDSIGAGHGNELKSCRQVNSPLSGGCNTNEHPRWDEDPWNGFFGTDDYGFSCLPGGYRHFVAAYEYLGSSGYWWTSTEYYTRYISCGGDDLLYRTKDARYGFSVRCIKFTCGDIVNYKGEDYNTVQIGDQCWFKENLNVGTMIDGISAQTNNSEIEKYCFDNDPANCDTYGGLYQWDEMMQYDSIEGTQGICPPGWHIPTDDEWCTLTQLVDPTVDCNGPQWSGTDVGTKMKSTAAWDPFNATNTSGFTALPGGAFGDSSFHELESGAYFWSSSVYDADKAWTRHLYITYENVGRSKSDRNSGFSLRCILD